jgi:predicted kinase
MIKVILTRGLPASGKTTWAKSIISLNPNSYKRINKDDLRAMLDNSIYSNDSEDFILQIRDAMILMAIENGKHVIVDDTNLASKHESRIRKLISGKAELVIQDFTDVPLETCIKRDLKRAVSVGEKVIRGMYKQFLMQVETYVENEELPKAIIVDIDGTLAKMKGRSPFEWNRVKEDSCNEVVKGLVNSYPNNVMVFSGRDAVCKQDTIDWLKENGIKYDGLFMREEGNNEKDSIIKRRMFEQNIRGKYFVEYVLDDRLSVCRMWHQMGLQLLRVGDPDADF